MDPVQKQKLKNYVSEIVVGMQRRKDATSFIRDVADAAKQDGFDAKKVRKMAKLALERNAHEVKAEIDELVDTLDNLEI